MKISATMIAVLAGVMLAAAKTAVTTNAPVLLNHQVKYPWKSSLSTGLTLTAGNKDSILFTADFSTQKKSRDNEFLLGLGGAYGQQDSKDTVNNYKAHVQWNRLFTEQFFGYLRADALQDRIKNLDYRVNVGPGAGYYLIKETNTTLAAEAGAGFEAQRQGDDAKVYSALRVADRFEHKFAERARLWQSVEILPQTDRFANYVVNFEVGIEAEITKTFTQKTYLVDTYSSEPAAGRQGNDVKLIAGIGCKF